MDEVEAVAVGPAPEAATAPELGAGEGSVARPCKGGFAAFWDLLSAIFSRRGLLLVLSERGFVRMQVGKYD